MQKLSKADLRKVIDVQVGSSGAPAVCEILELLAESMNESADHLRSNWQDDPSARVWVRAAKRVEKAEAEVRRILK